MKAQKQTIQISGILEIVALDLKHLSILQITVHDFKNRVRQAHTEEGEGYFLVAVELS